MVFNVNRNHKAYGYGELGNWGEGLWKWGKREITHRSRRTTISISCIVIINSVLLNLSGVWIKTGDVFGFHWNNYLHGSSDR